MKQFFIFLMVMILCVSFAEGAEKDIVSVFSPKEGHFPLDLPEDFYGVSKFAKGSYRLDGKDSYGRFNCIFLFFEKASELGQKNKEIVWREEKIKSDGRDVIRREAVLLNPRPQENDPSTEILRVRVDALTKDLADSLCKVAEELVKKAQPDPVAVPSNP